MNFSLRQLSVLAYANGFTLWHYKAEACGGVTEAGFSTLRRACWHRAT